MYKCSFLKTWNHYVLLVYLHMIPVGSLGFLIVFANWLTIKFFRCPITSNMHWERWRPLLKTLLSPTALCLSKRMRLMLPSPQPWTKMSGQWDSSRKLYRLPNDAIRPLRKRLMLSSNLSASGATIGWVVTSLWLPTNDLSPSCTVCARREE